MTRLPSRLLLLPILLLLAGACSSAGATPIPTGPPSASPSPSTPVALPVTTPDQAAQLVIASDARFASIGKKDPKLIGACCFYEATAGGDGSFAVTIEIGWGDCPSGCTDRHRWFYTVAADGTLVLVREEGSPVPDGAGGGGSGGDGVGGGILPGGPGIAGQALAGPRCPVVRPGDSNCNDRPVVGATILIRDSTGTVVAQMTTDADGRFQVKVPPGDYRIEPQRVEGLMGGADPIEVTVGADFKVVQLTYDTGIR